MIPCRINNLWALRSQVVDCLGKDQTGKIQYQFNSQGWRGNYEYNFVPDYAFFGSSSVLGIGVDQSQIFPSLFDRSHNYGLAVDYTNQDIVDSIIDFVSSELYSDQTKLAVVWTDRNPDMIRSSLPLFDHLNIVHFFCGEKMPGAHSWSMIANLDSDVSDTHMGPKTHQMLHKILCSIFKQ